MLSLVNANHLRQTSPLQGNRPASKAPDQPQDKLERADSQASSNSPKWLLAAFAGLGLAAGAAGAAQAQVVVVNQPQQTEDLMKQLEESSLQQGIKLEFMAPSPIGGGRTISSEDAAQMINDGQRVLLAEVTSSDGPFRGAEPVEVRREAYISGQNELASYTRYFTNAEPQNDMERAAQKLKKHIFLQTDLTTLMKPGANPDRPTLSPFEAARRLQNEQPVSLRTAGDGVIRLEASEIELGSLGDVDSLVDGDCGTVQNFQMNPDGTIQLVEQNYCGN
ncbi:MAG: hypothetical protein KF760_04055 [Candidatus Eremiobacteraeota bacterium]|nr:hypothetical protein [Candidatus Eremiobacteraeota bacterium]MCW5872479.1 hypothetical protein [Candidatus Eremiobacteraeota bacterium]